MTLWRGTCRFYKHFKLLIAVDIKKVLSSFSDSLSETPGAFFSGGGGSKVLNLLHFKKSNQMSKF